MIPAQPPQDHRDGRAIQRDGDIAWHHETHPSAFEQYLSDKFDREYPHEIQ